jgi:hypothetical protein
MDIGKSILNNHYYYMFNKFDDKKDSYYLEYVYKLTIETYGYVEKTQLSYNYQYYECVVDNNIKLDFTKGREHNENVVSDYYHTYSSVSEK